MRVMLIDITLNGKFYTRENTQGNLSPEGKQQVLRHACLEVDFIGPRREILFHSCFLCREDKGQGQLQSNTTEDLVFL